MNGRSIRTPPGAAVDIRHLWPDLLLQAAVVLSVGRSVKPSAKRLLVGWLGACEAIIEEPLDETGSIFPPESGWFSDRLRARSTTQWKFAGPLQPAKGWCNGEKKLEIQYLWGFLLIEKLGEWYPLLGPVGLSKTAPVNG